MDGCPTHQKEWRVVPAGVSSKTGKPYVEFLACPVFGCKEKPETEKQQITREYHEDMGVPAPTKAPTKPVDTEGAVWEAKDRMNMAQSALKAAAEILAAEIQAKIVPLKTFDEMREDNYKWLVSKKEGMSE